MDKKVAFLISFVVFLISGFFSYTYISSGKISPTLNTAYKPPSTNGDTADYINPNEPATEACPLNGQMYPKSQKAKWEKRRPLIIMVENHQEARPQSGLTLADNIYEIVAEGGITRFMTVFYCRDASYVGPVRSARIYFVHLAQGYGNQSLYAHVGGANTDGPADALGELQHIGWAGTNDMNEFSVPFPNFYRDPDRLPNRATEHTMYTSTSKLWAYAASNRKFTNVDPDGVAWNKGFTPWKFKDDAKTADRGTVGKISLSYWANSADYNVQWTYDPATNSYARVNGGQPHLDKNTSKQLTTKNVLVAFAKESAANDGYENGQHLLYGIIGTGNALVFQNGQVIKGTWAKDDATSMMRFYDLNGKEVSLVRGQDWIHVLPIGNKVEY